jgi:hypothetical protein
MNIYSVKKRSSTLTLLLLLLSLFIFLTALMRYLFPTIPDLQSYSPLYADEEESSLHQHTIASKLPKCWGNVLVFANLYSR